MPQAIEIDIPWPIAPLNAYLVEDDPLTLVDTGINMEANVRQLEEGLARHGRRIEDIERIVVTHQHIEHLGMSAHIRERSGAELCANSRLVPYLADHAGAKASEVRFEDELMRFNGVPDAVIEALRASEPGQDVKYPSCEVDRVLEDSDRLEFAGRSWHVLWRPGHSPYDTVYFDERRGEIFAGDHLLAHISVNPVITRFGESSVADPPRAMKTYRSSLECTRELGAALSWGGHGPPVEDPGALIGRRLERMDLRRERIAAVLGRGESSAHGIARAIWKDRAVVEPFLTLTEVIGHVEDLVDRGRAERRDREEGRVYAPLA